MDKRIGAQLYTLRDFCQTKEDFANAMARVSEIGYQTVQVSGIGPIAAEDIKEICDRNGLEIACTHRGYDEYVNQIDKIIDFHKKLDCNIAGLGAMPAEFSNGDHLDRLVETLNGVTETLSAHGISFAYHNHQFEFQKLANGQFIMDYMIENGKFDFIVDVYWLAFAGIDPAAFIRKLGKRAIVIHFKDLAIIGHDITMAEVMEGNLDWDSIIQASEAAGSRWAMVEQDVCRRNPFESMKISYDNLRKKNFV